MRYFYVAESVVETLPASLKTIYSWPSSNWQDEVGAVYVNQIKMFNKQTELPKSQRYYLIHLFLLLFSTI